MKQYFLFLLCFLLAANAQAQTLKIVSGERAETNSSQHFLRGMTDANAKIEVNNREFKVYKTGAFAAEVQLAEGNNLVKVTSTLPNGQSTEKSFNIKYVKRNTAKSDKLTASGDAAILYFETVPEKITAVTAGEQLRFCAHATPNCILKFYDTEMKESPAGSGKYFGTITVAPNDRRLDSLSLNLTTKEGKFIYNNKTICGETNSFFRKIEILSPEKPIIVKTIDPLPYLNYGLGTDRLGGSKLSRIVGGIKMAAIGKVGDMYKVRLSKNRNAWIPESCVTIDAEADFAPQSLVGSWVARGNDSCDIVRISLNERLPFASFQQTDPSKICIDIYGAIANTAWLIQYPETFTAIKQLDYEQIDEDIFRVIITLKSKQHWGYSISYDGTNMLISAKKQPKLTLRGLRVAIDAGHGGKSSGAVGTTGLLEKNINLTLAKLLKNEMEKRGAVVTLTRSADIDVSMTERQLLLRKINPDILISIHCNAGGSPFTAKGTSTYYRHIGFRPLALSILNRMLALGLNNYGNVGSFNFSLNSPTEYPNALVETMFMSSPEDEEKLLDEKFRLKIVKQIANGVEDFLKQCK